ncbi:MAG: PAS domain S-box protein [Deltaproteobacteria bacterium]|nr:PAS domain S-box protein [Deltaproteobacteria bacterium]
MHRFRKISFKNKILLSTLLVILLLSAGVFVAIRWILLPSLISQLKLRGLGIAQSIADSSKAYILTENTAELTSLLFDTAQLEERKPLIAYIFILDMDDNVLSHNFTYPFPPGLAKANVILPEQSHKIKRIPLYDRFAYDIAVPVLEGIYQVGTVHVGLSKEHIDDLIGKLLITLLSIISAIVVVVFGISHFLSKYISRPVLHLAEVADEIGSGNLEVRADLSSEMRCWEIRECRQQRCPAHENTDVPCWYIDGTLCVTECMAEQVSGLSKPPVRHRTDASMTGDRSEASASEMNRSADPYGERTPHPLAPASRFPEKLKICRGCPVYTRRIGDEIARLADSFNNMTFRLKTSKAELKESEEKYRFLFDYDPNSIFVLDPESLEILDVNARALEIYGYRKEELIGISFLELGPGEYANGILSRHGEEAGTQLSIYTKMEHWRKGMRPFHVNIYACRTGHGAKPGIIATTIDITENLAKEAQLIQASKMSTLGEMASGVAHEINQPLSAIQIVADFIKNVANGKDEIPRDELEQVSRHMTEQVDRAVRIINHLRAFGRKAEIRKEKVNINKPIEGVLTLLGQQLKLRGIEVVLDLDENLSPITGDANRLEQVFMDLIINARDSIEEKRRNFVTGKTVTRLGIKSLQENGSVVITVWDTGTGIPNDIREKIFDPFFTTKEVGRGTGLGLSISYGIIKDYGGTIEVESEEGKGATFKITFPAWREVKNGFQKDKDIDC